MNETPNIQIAGEIPAFKHGICPLMTSSQVMAAGRASNIVEPPGGAMAVAQVTNYVPCAGEKCQLWDIGYYRCSIVSMPVLIETLYNITAPARGAPDASK